MGVFSTSFMYTPLKIWKTSYETQYQNIVGVLNCPVEYADVCQQGTKKNADTLQNNKIENPNKVTKHPVNA